MKLTSLTTSFNLHKHRIFDPPMHEFDAKSELTRLSKDMHKFDTKSKLMRLKNEIDVFQLTQCCFFIHILLYRNIPTNIFPKLKL